MSAALTANAADPSLRQYPVDPNQVSVAGISSGAFMANQLHVAHSAGIMGAALVAGGLYGCAVLQVQDDGVYALASRAVDNCMSTPTLLPDVGAFADMVSKIANKGWIDPPSNLARSNVYIFTGVADQVVSPKVVELAARLYSALGVPNSQIRFEDGTLQAGHAWVTPRFGNPCNANAPPFINGCNHDQAGIELQTIYGTLHPPTATPEGRIVAFDQSEFVPGGNAMAQGMMQTGYLYLPKACEPGAEQTCRLQVALHGCLQSAEAIHEQFYTKIGLNEWADTNRIIVLYPQAHATKASELPWGASLFNTNMNSCWDWWGYASDNVNVSDKQYLTKQGVQVSAIWAMVQRITGRGN
ncbi:MAG: depolymerase [Candidatus Eremiobacteraeota bacterium]|nr:depolymerase [Candidatus Eremiobacteraeota bacterium]